SVIGSMEDLNAASIEDVRSFFKTYYAPNNAIVAIAGDVNAASTLDRARKYFESIPSQPAPPPVDVSQPPQHGERRLMLEDSLASNLAWYALLYGDPGRINTRYERLARFNASDVQRVAKQCLTPDNRSVVITRPKPAAASKGAL